MAWSVIGLALMLVFGSIGFVLGFVIGERRGRRTVQQGFPVLPVAPKDQQ
jgi:hypothetical protein